METHTDKFMKTAPTGLKSGVLAGLAVLGIAFLGSITSADAQLMVGLKLKKKYYVSYEPIQAEVSVSNRSGKDVVLGARLEVVRRLRGGDARAERVRRHHERRPPGRR